MAARGAASRRAMKKKIESNERRQAAQDFIQNLSRPPSQRSGWDLHIRPTLPSPTHSRKRWSLTAQTVKSFGSNQSKAESQAVSDGTGSKAPANGSRESKKYTATGKETAHPRGRGGDVPMRVALASRANTPMVPSQHPSASEVSRFDFGITQSYPQKTWDGMKLWPGQGRPPMQYHGFEQDPDLWAPDGDCFVYFSEETDEEYPRPSLRVHVSMLERAKSRFLSSLLRYSETKEVVVTGCDRPGTAFASGSHMLTMTNLDAATEAGASMSWTGSERNGMPRSQRDSYMSGSPDFRSQLGNPTSPPHANDLMTPSTSTAPSEIASANGKSKTNPEITHEIWFRAPSHITKPDIQRRHHIATRNFLALLYGKGPVGNDYYDMLSDLQNVMDTYYELNDPEDRKESVRDIMNHLHKLQLDDVRYNLKAALGLLAWCEQPSVRWDEGYLEAFVHSVGMFSAEDRRSSEFANLLPVTRHNLENAFHGMQLRIREAEDRLATFNFADIWQECNVSSSSPVVRSMTAFQNFLTSFYRYTFRVWPPPSHTGRWLTRDLVRTLDKDFGSLYDYLVDRDVKFDASEERAGRKWEMVCTKPRPAGFSADAPGLPLTDMFITFDYVYHYQHIPHPYPLLPQSPYLSKERPAKKSLFAGLRKARAAASLDPKMQFQMSVAFSGATNINKLGITFEDNPLITAFVEYEKSPHAQPAGVTPRDARLGRWILLYGVLQVLSTVSVDAQGLRYVDDGLKYFVSPSLAGCPPWRPPDHPGHMQEASQEESYCWAAGRRWGEVRTPMGTEGKRAVGGIGRVRWEDGRASGELDGKVEKDRDGEPDGWGVGRGAVAARFGSPRPEGTPMVPVKSPIRGWTAGMERRTRAGMEESYFDDESESDGS